MKVDIPRRELVYPLCHRCGGPLTYAEDLPVSADDSDLPESMEGEEWLFTGDRCFECEYRSRGTYKRKATEDE